MLMKCPECGYIFKPKKKGEVIAKEVENLLKETREKMFFDDIYKSLIKRNPEWKKYDYEVLAVNFGVYRERFTDVKN
jgi:rubredoxin